MTLVAIIDANNNATLSELLVDGQNWKQERGSSIIIGDV